MSFGRSIVWPYIVCAVFVVSVQVGDLSRAAQSSTSQAYDIVVYGGTSAAVTSAVQAKKMGKSVIIVSPDKHLGGLSSGGLGWTDSGKKEVIGGLSREFYHRVWREYQSADAWKWQKREEYGNQGQGTTAMDAKEKTMWIFEPHIAEKVFDDWVVELKIPVVRSAWLDREKGVRKIGQRIMEITTLDGNVYAGKMFIDATYEGDLMAAAGVSYFVGREANSVYGEKHNGIQTGILHHRHHFDAVPVRISPYRVPGEPSSGILPRISANNPGIKGEGDKKVQAYCFRTCLTTVPENRLAFPKPDGYDPNQYELMLRIYQAGWRETFDKFDPIPNRKTDTNNHGPMSSDNIGFNYDYPEASYERRREIIAEHEQYQKGWYYFIANDLRVPQDVRQAMSQWGLAKDEFTDNGHWPHQIYVREARRMIGKFVMTENELTKVKPTPDPVGMGSYTIDSHNIQRYITAEGYVQNEGDIGVPTNGPYSIAFGALVPQVGECENLLVPVCASCSHIAFGSIRMEPVFMILGQSAATAAILAIDHGTSVQHVDYARLKKRLRADGQILELPDAKLGVLLEGTVVDDQQAQFAGQWSVGSIGDAFVGVAYHHDQNQAKGSKTATFSAKLPSAGRYEVRLAYVPHQNRASNVLVEVQHAAGVTRTHVDQRKRPTIAKVCVSLGVFEFNTPSARVVISNAGTDGYVVADAIQWLPVN